MINNLNIDKKFASNEGIKYLWLKFSDIGKLY